MFLTSLDKRWKNVDGKEPPAGDLKADCFLDLNHLEGSNSDCSIIPSATLALLETFAYIQHSCSSVRRSAFLDLRPQFLRSIAPKRDGFLFPKSFLITPKTTASVERRSRSGSEDAPYCLTGSSESLPKSHQEIEDGPARRRS